MIDRYLDNSLTGVELKDFLDKLESDDEFKKAVSLHNLLIEGIQEAEDKRLKDAIERSINYRKPLIPVGLKLIILFLIITTIGISLWNYIEPDSTGRRHDYFTFDFLKGIKKDSVDVQSVSKESQPNKTTGIKKTTIARDTVIDNPEKTNADTAPEKTAGAEDIVVKKDQLLISFVLTPKNLESDSIETEESSLSKKTIDKLPSGGLPDNEKKRGVNYQVEFWVSPVNYKGYKLVDDKLILFGIDVPDAVRLYTKQDKLWMKYGQDIYYLEPTEQFESLVLTSEIPVDIK